mmetsp:Transcript_30333/g.74274  ORF Transcript_30333/g.74274 Transcript_30333/m.74274 type:complete len:173 (-) Transcript_30333:265-783(-)|eukprot:CAMPEP_0114113934 /NCGR_PEP_ID=MMETSP0043_2-20121206/3172_1 /TAXON_ID=464988 /ORGANISM="Hemiselmis andersenii, Strain CCMP644" /LENGTH=172 /DNA_ID=CAMNT_0001206107 /DNA_START=86 /DNA_END=604 /DNA_ORIENTATION=-
MEENPGWFNYVIETVPMAICYIAITWYFVYPVQSIAWILGGAWSGVLTIAPWLTSVIYYDWFSSIAFTGIMAVVQFIMIVGFVSGFAPYTFMAVICPTYALLNQVYHGAMAGMLGIVILSLSLGGIFAKWLPWNHLRFGRNECAEANKKFFVLEYRSHVEKLHSSAKGKHQK